MKLCVVGLWGRGAENAILYIYIKALILASELIRPGAKEHHLYHDTDTASEVRNVPYTHPDLNPLSPTTPRLNASAARGDKKYKGEARRELKSTFGSKPNWPYS